MFQSMPNILIGRLLAGFLLLPIAGCSSHKTTETTTTEVRHAPDGDDVHVVHTDPDTEHVTTKTETKTTEVDTDSGSGHGLFGILGDIIALPFRAVGALLSAIF